MLPKQKHNWKCGWMKNDGEFCCEFIETSYHVCVLSFSSALNPFNFRKQNRRITWHIRWQLFECYNIWKASAKKCKYCVYFNFVFARLHLHLSHVCCYLVFIVSFVLHCRHMYFSANTQQSHWIESHGSEQI